MSMCVVKGVRLTMRRLVCVYVCGEGGTADHEETGMCLCVVKGVRLTMRRLVCVYVCGEGGTADHEETGMCLCVWYADIVRRLKGMADQNITKLYLSIIVCV